MYGENIVIMNMTGWSCQLEKVFKEAVNKPFIKRNVFQLFKTGFSSIKYIDPGNDRSQYECFEEL
jgi:hypothetical protein